MLRMDPFVVERPQTLAEATELLKKHGEQAKLCAGGTDVLPNIKHGLHEPQVLVHLGRTAGLRGLTEEDGALHIGAMTTLHDLARHPLVQEKAPALADAARAVAGPQLRRMGTLGGNLCLDTRCLYYNQTHFWRESLGYCLKKDGSVCHVVTSGKKCVAAASNDTATVLLALGAEVDLLGPAGERSLPLSAFYVADGAANTVLAPDEILVRCRVPLTHAGAQRVAGFAKLRHRQSIDYPLLSISVRFDLDDNAQIVDAAVTVNALAAKPKQLKTKAFIGRPLDDATVAELAAFAQKKCNPQTNICDDPGWRKQMVSVFVTRACDAERARQC